MATHSDVVSSKCWHNPAATLPPQASQTSLHLFALVDRCIPLQIVGNKWMILAECKEV